MSCEVDFGILHFSVRGFARLCVLGWSYDVRGRALESRGVVAGLRSSEAGLLVGVGATQSCHRHNHHHHHHHQSYRHLDSFLVASQIKHKDAIRSRGIEVGDIDYRSDASAASGYDSDHSEEPATLTHISKLKPGP